MATQTLRDRNNNIIGYIDVKPDGSQVGKDRVNNIKGYYDAKQNTTKDRNNRIVGQGNLLAALITSP